MLRSPSAGKLLQYLVADGSHVLATQPYAEIEVKIRHFIFLGSSFRLQNAHFSYAVYDLVWFTYA